MYFDGIVKEEGKYGEGSSRVRRERGPPIVKVLIIKYISE